jgi:histone H3/H4
MSSPLSVLDEEAIFKSLLSTMDVEADALVVKALAEAARRYAGDLLISAKDYSKHANPNKRAIDDDDFQLAMALQDSRVNRSQIRQRVIRESAETLNARPLPPIPDHTLYHRVPSKPDIISRTYTYVPGIEAYPSSAGNSMSDDKISDTNTSTKAGAGPPIVRKEINKFPVKIHTTSL